MYELHPLTFSAEVGQLRHIDKYRYEFVSLFLPYGKIFSKERIIIRGDLNGRKYFGFLILLTDVSMFDSDPRLSNLIPKGSFVPDNPK